MEQNPEKDSKVTTGNINAMIDKQEHIEGMSSKAGDPDAADIVLAS
jgi:hypothetical protein